MPNKTLEKRPYKVIVCPRFSNRTLPLPEEKHHGSAKSFKVDNIIQNSLMLYVSEEVDSNDGVDECYQEQESPDIEECWQRYHHCQE